MHFAISIPQVVPDGGFDPASLRAYLTRAEEIGFHSAWTQEAILGVAPILSPLELMTFAASCTHQLRLGCAVFVSPLHSPLHLAKSISTLDQISHGRTEVGIALGGRARMPDVFGVEAESLTSRFVEGLKLMKACWSESSITFTGRFWQFSGISMEPKPFQKPYPPLWIGGSHPEALRRAARYGDGFFGAGASTTTQFSQQVHIVRQALKTYGRDDAHFQIAKRVYIAVNDDVVSTRERVRAALAQFYGVSGLPGVPDLSTLATYGPPAVCIEGLREVASIGADLIQLNLLFEDSRQMEQLASEVIPYI
jgi:alkanesulfonate monooxygenase SsuD/methylene tetrahydromethanopterin reductase-like flavin-dependent oxidoreductase (luciferase family)